MLQKGINAKEQGGREEQPIPKQDQQVQDLIVYLANTNPRGVLSILNEAGFPQPEGVDEMVEATVEYVKEDQDEAVTKLCQIFPFRERLYGSSPKIQYSDTFDRMRQSYPASWNTWDTSGYNMPAPTVYDRMKIRDPLLSPENLTEHMTPRTEYEMMRNALVSGTYYGGNAKQADTGKFNTITIVFMLIVALLIIKNMK